METPNEKADPMNAMSFLLTYVVNAAWQATVIAAVGLLAAQLLKRLGPRAEHLVWVLSLAIAVILPAMPVVRSLLGFFERRQAVAGHGTTVSVTASYSTPEFSGLFQWHRATIWTLAGCYLVVLLFAVFRIGRSLYAAWRLIEDAQPLCLTSEQEEIWSQCEGSFAAGEVRLMSSDQIDSPVVLGVRRTTLLVPGNYLWRCAAPDLLTALAHEFAHAERCDFQKNLCYEAVALLLAFHPAIWFIKSQITQTREMVCDRMVAERVLGARAYAQSLLRLAAMVAMRPRAATSHAIGIFDANILEKRIMMINRARRTYGLMMRFGLSATAVSMLAATCAIAASRAVAIEPDSASSANQATSSGPLYKVGGDVSAPVLVHQVDAEFPKTNQKPKAPFGATVLVRTVVDKNGIPQDVHVVHTVVNNGGTPGQVHVVRSYDAAFDKEAVKAVEQWRFKAGMKAGVPVAVVLNVEVNFKLY
jgi:TonB family protein